MDDMDDRKHSIRNTLSILWVVAVFGSVLAYLVWHFTTR